MLVPGLLAVARKLSAASVVTDVFTSGPQLDWSASQELADTFAGIHISIDGALAETHDRIRVRSGAFERAMAALEAFLSVQPRVAKVGIEYTVLRSNLAEISQLCELVTRRLPTLDFVKIGAAVPSGLATRPSFAATELLSDEELQTLRNPDLRHRLAGILPRSTALHVMDNWHLLPRPGRLIPIQIEPDGRIRAFPIYEGTVGNILHEPLEQIWKRAKVRHCDPAIIGLHDGVTSMAAWAEVARQMDQRFGRPDDLLRIQKRT